MKRNNKKGFTVVELVIVIAVIAILSAVLIPTFAGVARKAKLSADEQLVRNINLVLKGADNDVDTKDEIINYLKENGYDNITDCAPVSKDHSLVWSAKDKTVMLYSAKANAIVYPAKFAGKEVNFEIVVNDKGVTPTVATGDKTFENGGLVAIVNDMTVENKYLDIKNDLVIDLNATISSPTNTARGGLFTVYSSAKLTLNGNGTVNAKFDDTNDYNMAVWAYGGDVVINGGYYTNVGAKEFEDNGTTKNNNELIYVTAGGKVTINGGSFKCANPYWTLNVKDNAPASIIVKGGEFFEYNPAADANDDGTIVPDGYTVVSETRADGTWYKVVLA